MLSIELDIYSGMPNPTWILSDKEEQELVDRIMAQPTLMQPVSTSTTDLGYRGFIISVEKESDGAWNKANLASASPLPTTFRIGGAQNLEPQTTQWLLQTSDKMDTEVDDYLRDITYGAISQSMTDAQLPLEPPLTDEDLPDIILPGESQDEELIVEEAEVDPALAAEDSGAELTGYFYYCGYNYFTGTNFSFWNGAAYIRYNNCYNFAANHRSNTFAKPGLRAGKTFRSLSFNHMAEALAADGWGNACATSRNLTIALVVWPGRDFHFYRMVSRSGTTMVWGHKPGQTQARYTDDLNRVIRSPQTAARGNYTLFYGYWYQDNSKALVK